MRAAAAAAFVLLAACNSAPPPAKEQAAAPEPARPKDETRRFPLANQVTTELVTNHLFGKTFMPGGTLAHYKRGNTTYNMFIARSDSPTDAAILLLDWKKELQDAQLVPSFGGYFGKDRDTPVFVFPKGPWIAGITGLPQKEADTQARTLAAQLPAQ